MSLAEREQKLKQEFAQLPTWEEKYRKIIELGKSLPPLDMKFQSEDFRVKGCQSQVWLTANLDDTGHMVLRADSDALISRGLVALLLEVYSGSYPADVLIFKPTFLAEMGLADHLSPSRANGLFSMLKQIIIYATAFAAQSSAR